MVCARVPDLPRLKPLELFMIPAAVSASRLHIQLASVAVLLGLVSWSCTLAQTETAVSADTPAAKGHVVDAPASVRNFNPKATDFTTADALHVDLRKIFEDLGPDATLWYQHVQTLANPFFEGRAPGTHGADVAADYIEFYMRQYGLEPAFPGPAVPQGGEKTTAFTSYRQPFDFASP